MLGHRVVVFCFWIPYGFPQWLHEFTFPPAVYENSLFSISSPAFVICVLFDDRRTDRYEAISCGFDLHCYEDEWCWASFHVPIGYLYLFWRNVYLLICLLPIFKLSCLVFWCFSMSYLHSLDINPLLVMLLANIFSYL